MSLQRQHFLLSYLKTLSVGPAGVRTHDLRLSRPALSQLSVMFSSFSYRVLFQRFFPQNISLLPKIVTEAHAKIRKRKPAATLYFEALCSHGQVHPFGTFESNFQSDLLAGSTFSHLFIIKVHMGCSALLHSAHFPPALYHFMN